MDILQTTSAIFTKIPLNIFDYILICCFILYIYEELILGAKAALSHTISIIAAFLMSVSTYGFLSSAFTQVFSISKGIADAVSFFLIAILVYVLTSRILFLFTRKFFNNIPRLASKTITLVSGSLSFFLIASFVIAIFLSFPVALSIKHAIHNSFTGNFFLTKTQHLELSVKYVFKNTIEETLNFLTIKPESDSSVDLYFTATDVSIDSLSEKKMLRLLNQARKERGLLELSQDNELTQVARLHGKDMLKRGYFSHYTPEGYTPFDRLEAQRIVYTAAAENLAYAPEVELAFSGLMKSEGHKKNILDSSFQKIGIGVVDAGIYGKMFVQEFTD